MTGQILAATIGTVAFSVLYSVPRAYYPYCGFIGGAGWLVYCLLIPRSSPPEATFFAAILVVLLSRLLCLASFWYSSCLKKYFILRIC